MTKNQKRKENETHGNFFKIQYRIGIIMCTQKRNHSHISVDK